MINLIIYFFCLILTFTNFCVLYKKGLNEIKFWNIKRPNSPIPGFGLTMGYTVFYLSIVIIPLIALLLKLLVWDLMLL